MSEETQQEKALFRFQVIGPLLALDLPRGKRRATLEELAGKTWTLQNGENLKVSQETIRRWLRLYREGVSCPSDLAHLNPVGNYR